MGRRSFSLYVWVLYVLFPHNFTEHVMLPPEHCFFQMTSCMWCIKLKERQKANSLEIIMHVQVLNTGISNITYKLREQVC